MPTGVPLDQMTDAEHAVRKAAADIPAEVLEQLGTADKLSDEDRQTIIEIARKALEEFKPWPPQVLDNTRNRCARWVTTIALWSWGWAHASGKAGRRP